MNYTRQVDSTGNVYEAWFDPRYTGAIRHLHTDANGKVIWDSAPPQIDTPSDIKKAIDENLLELL